MLWHTLVEKSMLVLNGAFRTGVVAKRDAQLWILPSGIKNQPYSCEGRTAPEISEVQTCLAGGPVGIPGAKFKI